jgi:hypothetical protein
MQCNISKDNSLETMTATFFSCSYQLNNTIVLIFITSLLNYFLNARIYTELSYMIDDDDDDDDAAALDARIMLKFLTPLWHKYL